MWKQYQEKATSSTVYSSYTSMETFFQELCYNLMFFIEILSNGLKLEGCVYMGSELGSGSGKWWKKTIAMIFSA